MGSLSRSHRHFLPVSGNRHALVRTVVHVDQGKSLGHVLPHQRQQEPPGSKAGNSPSPILCGPRRTRPVGKAWDTGRGPGFAELSAISADPLDLPPCSAIPGSAVCPPPPPGSAAPQPPSGYLELLLSPMVEQHELLVLLAAHDGLPGRGTLPPLKRQKQRKLGTEIALQGTSERNRRLFYYNRLCQYRRQQS